jgi:hypothetical protein
VRCLSAVILYHLTAVPVHSAAGARFICVTTSLVRVHQFSSQEMMVRLARLFQCSMFGFQAYVICTRYVNAIGGMPSRSTKLPAIWKSRNVCSPGVCLQLDVSTVRPVKGLQLLLCCRAATTMRSLCLSGQLVMSPPALRTPLGSAESCSWKRGCRGRHAHLQTGIGCLAGDAQIGEMGATLEVW